MVWLYIYVKTVKIELKSSQTIKRQRQQKREIKMLRIQIKYVIAYKVLSWNVTKTLMEYLKCSQYVIKYVSTIFKIAIITNIFMKLLKQ